jgi:hypothetical protein
MSVGHVTASQLSKCVLNNSSITDTVKEQLLIIDKKLLASNKTIGDNEVIVDLPAIFPTLPVARDLAQVMIYGAIMKSLEHRGFIPSIIVTDHHAKMYIKWMVEMTSTEINSTKKYVMSRMRGPNYDPIYT